MCKISFVNFKVRCPRDRGEIRLMQMRFVEHEGRLIPAPCNGCDELNGADVCSRCTAYFTQAFFEDPALDVFYPLVPNLQGQK